MSLASMTGFARLEHEAGGTRLVWEMRSVNGKGLEVRLRLPPGLEALEPELKKRAGARLSRGHLQVALQVTRQGTPAAFSINRALLAEICAVTDELVTAGHASPPTADGLLALRGVIDAREPDASGEGDPALRQAAGESFDRALDALLAARAEEGAAIAAILSRRLDEMEALLVRALADPSREPAAIALRLRGQIEALTQAGAGLDPARLAQEAALIATRADIAEELDRLATHVASARALLASGEAVGRRLDFLSQEFNRESNTICSKSNASALTAIGLELKIVVDQFREQVQNVE